MPRGRANGEAAVRASASQGANAMTDMVAWRSSKKVHSIKPVGNRQTPKRPLAKLAGGRGPGRIGGPEGSNARPGGSSTNGPVMTAGYGGASRSCQQQPSTTGKHWPSLVASTSRWSGRLGWGKVRGRSLPALGLHSAAIALSASSSLASISPRRMRSISGLEILTSGGRTTARGMRPSRTRASFMRLCISTKGLA